MKKLLLFLLLGLLAVSGQAFAQTADSLKAAPTVLNLEDVIKIALSENTSIKVADKEIERVGWAKKGTYAALYPQVDLVGSYQRTIKKQVMYMDSDSGFSMPGSDDGIAFGRWNNFTAGVNASMPLVNAQLWKSLKISGEEVELSIEKARSSRLETVNQVKHAFYAVLLAKASFGVYREVYDNAFKNLEQTRMKFNAQRASELDLHRAKTTLANTIPSVYEAESAVILALWQLKAVMGVSLTENIDIAGKLEDYSGNMLFNRKEYEGNSLSDNSSLRQLAIQAIELADQIKLQQAAYIPSLSLGFSYNVTASNNSFNFSEYKWPPYSYVGLSLNIPIFSGFKRQSQVRQAKVQSQEIELQRSNAERQLRISIMQNLNLMETAVKSLSSAQVAVESATKAYSIAEKSYSIGRSTLTDLNDALLALTQANLSVAQAVYSFLAAKADLENTIGKDI